MSARSPFRINVAEHPPPPGRPARDRQGEVDDLFVSGERGPARLPGRGGRRVAADRRCDRSHRHRDRHRGQGPCRGACRWPTEPSRAPSGRCSRTRHEEGETLPLLHDEIDLEPLVRETVAARACPRRPSVARTAWGCAPPVGSDRNEGTCSCEPALDPRWSALDELRTTDARRELRHPMAVPKKKTSKTKTRSRRASNWTPEGAAAEHLPAVRARPSCPTSCAATAAGTAAARPSTSTDAAPATILPIAVDAMGGDHAPGEIIAGAPQAAAELGVPIVLVGPPELIGDPLGLEIVPCTEVIDMDEDAAPRPCGARRTPRSSCAAEAGARRQGQRHGSAPATPAPRWPPPCCGWAASGASAGRPSPPRSPCRAPPPRCCSTPGPTPSVKAEWLVQFAQMGTAYCRARYGIATPTGRAPHHRRGGDQGHVADQGGLRPAPRGAPGSTSSATSRGVTS